MNNTDEALNIKHPYIDTISSLTCKWETDSLTDDEGDTLLYSEYIADLSEKMLNRGSASKISRSDWNEYESFIRAFRMTSKSLI
jgi:hypothetical protein